ncbi:MAG TPA: hypothetical protein VGZ91_04480 [Candidatus Sulfotelmatobacter sp.]|jgi:hypothetical protein|nr:hypothetical protein [Candidatus Sulfotelmatobacter sp.]
MNITSVFATTTADDGFKFFLLLLAVVGLILLGKWSSRLGASSGDGALPETPTFAADEPPGPRPFAPGGDQIAASFPNDPSLGKIRMKNFFFEKTDALSGPPDRNEFADDLHIELYDSDSGNGWWQSYFVATPQGLAQILRDRSWKYLHAREILVLPRYDLEEIRRAAVTRIINDHEFFKPDPGSEEEVL